MTYSDRVKLGLLRLVSAINTKVAGPAGAVTDNALVRWDSTTSRLVQGSGAILNDSDDLQSVRSLHWIGAFRNSTTTRTANITLNLTSHSYIQYGDATAGALTFTLPSTGVAGWMTLIQKIDSSANAVNIVGTVNGVSGYALTKQYQWVILASSGAASPGTWHIIGRGGVQGPATAVDRRIAVFDGTSGDLIKDGGVTLGASGAIAFSNVDMVRLRTLMTTRTGDVTLVTDSPTLNYLDASAGSFVVTMASTPTNASGIHLIFKRIDDNYGAIVTFANAQFENGETISLYAGEAIHVVSDNVSGVWRIINRYSPYESGLEIAYVEDNFDAVWPVPLYSTGYTPVPNLAIAIPPTPRPVKIEAGANFQCTTSGTGLIGLAVAETSAGTINEDGMTFVGDAFVSTGSFAPLIGGLFIHRVVKPSSSWRYYHMVSNTFRDSGSFAASMSKSHAGGISTPNSRAAFVRAVLG